jgi:hypothetical protein
MGSTSVADAPRQSLGPAGAYLPRPLISAPPAGLQREAARRLGQAKRLVFTVRTDRATSTMAKGVFRWAAGEAEGKAGQG